MEDWENRCRQEYNLVKPSRVKAALEKKEADFAAVHGKDNREELVGYLCECARSLDYTPAPMEVIGSRVILAQFGSWSAAVEAAGLAAVSPGLMEIPRSATELYHQEENAQWLKFRKAYKKGADKARASKSYAKTRQKMAAKKLEKVLASPGRQSQEKTFAAAHAADTNRQLYEYFKAEKRRRGKEMKPVNTVGYRTLTQRLGDWSVVMGRINAELAEEKEKERIPGDTVPGESHLTLGG